MNNNIPITIGFEKTELVGKVSLTQRAIQVLQLGMFHLTPTLLKKPNGTIKIIEFSIIPCPIAKQRKEKNNETDYQTRPGHSDGKDKGKKRKESAGR